MRIDPDSDTDSDPDKKLSKNGAIIVRSLISLRLRLRLTKLTTSPPTF
jgi:hypothetical protein